MKTAIAFIVPALVVAACNKGPQVHEENASVDEVAAKVREATGGGEFIRAGEWKSVTTVEEMNVPGMPPEAAKQMKAAMARNGSQEFTTCLTEADVKQPKGKFFTGNDQCRYDHFTMGGGKIDAAMRCEAKGSGTQVMAMTGTYSPESYSMRMEMTAEGMPGPTGGMTMKMKVDSKRIGDCSAKSNSVAG
jgi:hypothetical protein